MKRFLSILVFMCVLVSYAQAEDVIRAVTEDGRHVVLFPDGTWVARPVKSTPMDTAPATKPASAASYVKGGNGAYTIYFDPTKWAQEDSPFENAEIFLHDKKGDGYAMTVFERIPIPLANLRKIVLQNAQKAAPDAKILEASFREVNGVQVMVLKMAGLFEGIPLVYYGYYVSGDWGTLQFVTYTADSLFDEYKPDFEELLNGLVLPN